MHPVHQQRVVDLDRSVRVWPRVEIDWSNAHHPQPMIGSLRYWSMVEVLYVAHSSSTVILPVCMMYHVPNTNAVFCR
jgi:hypothetical protein